MLCETSKGCPRNLEFDNTHSSPNVCLFLLQNRDGCSFNNIKNQDCYTYYTIFFQINLQISELLRNSRKNGLHIDEEIKPRRLTSTLLARTCWCQGSRAGKAPPH